MIPNFSFLLPGILAGSSRPGDYGGTLPEHLTFLHDQGIRGVISLTEDSLPRAALAEAGLDYLHLPVIDFEPPSHEQLVSGVAFIDDHRERGDAVLVHCRAGIGRTGTMLAAYLVSRGAPPDEAMAQVRALRPGSIETIGQEEAIRLYAVHRGSGR